MSEIINFYDRTPKGTFSQIKLDDGKRILVSFTQKELAIFKLTLGAIPVGKIFKHDISEFLDFFSVKIKQVGIGGSFLQTVVDYILPCKNMEEVAEKMNAVVKGYDDPAIKEKTQQKLGQQVQKLFAEKDFEEVKTVVSEYGKIMEKAGLDLMIKYPAGVFPESILPFPKEKIVESIKTYILNTNDEKVIESLGNGLVWIDNFINDKEANERNRKLLENKEFMEALKRKTENK